jgi:hypothetical protein
VKDWEAVRVLLADKKKETAKDAEHANGVSRLDYLKAVDLDFNGLRREWRGASEVIAGPCVAGVFGGSIFPVARATRLYALAAASSASMAFFSC